MTGETVYLNVTQITEVCEPEVFLKDIASIYCKNRSVEAKIKTIRVHRFQTGGKKRGDSYIGSTLDLFRNIESLISGIQIENLGELDFIVKYRPQTTPNAVLQWIKTAIIALVSFCGSAFAIMTFNNDVNVPDVFSKIYYLVMGTEAVGPTILEVSYSLGIAIGILVFFNHFAGWKLTVDPTPIEVEMRLYEDNLNKTLIQNHGRKEKEIDVS